MGWLWGRKYAVRIVAALLLTSALAIPMGAGATDGSIVVFNSLNGDDSYNPAETANFGLGHIRDFRVWARADATLADRVDLATSFVVPSVSDVAFLSAELGLGWRCVNAQKFTAGDACEGHVAFGNPNREGEAGQTNAPHPVEVHLLASRTGADGKPLPDEAQVLENFIVNVPHLGAGGLVAVNSQMMPVLKAGQRYWLAVMAGHPHTSYQWYSNRDIAGGMGQHSASRSFWEPPNEPDLNDPTIEGEWLAGGTLLFPKALRVTGEATGVS